MEELYSILYNYYLNLYIPVFKLNYYHKSNISRNHWLVRKALSISWSTRTTSLLSSHHISIVFLLYKILLSIFETKSGKCSISRRAFLSMFSNSTQLSMSLWLWRITTMLVVCKFCQSKVEILIDEDTSNLVFSLDNLILIF